MRPFSEMSNMTLLFYGCPMVQFNHKGGDCMTFKQQVLQMLSLEKNKWNDIKGKEQDMTQENFVDNVMLVLDWVMRDIEKMKEG